MRRILFIMLLCLSTGATAQNLRERGEVRKGNREYLKEDYAAAVEHYRQAVAESPENFEARYNLASALIKGEQVEEADKLLASLAADSLLSDRDRADSFYNLGNSQFQQQKLEEALESYKDAMRLDPDDQEAKYNYAYTKALLQQNQDENQDNQDQNEDQDNQDQNEDQDNQDQNQDQNEDQQDQDQNEDQQDQGDQDQPQDQQEQPQPEPQISEQEQQQMLDAIQAQEDKTQDDLKERARGVVVQGAKNW